jgi:hypothetical protein
VTLEERRRRVTARLRSEMSPEELQHVDELPAWAHPIGPVIDTILVDLVAGGNPLERPR